VTIVTEPRVVVRDRLSADEITQVLALVDAATQADGVGPLSEQTILALRAGGSGLLTFADGRIAGYAYLDLGSAELVVHPAMRRHGHGRALAVGLATQGGELRVWAHGDLPAAAALAASLGWSRRRGLLQMRRPLRDPLPDAPPPPGVRIRTFWVGEDEEAWVAVNRRAFAGHPEQGRWTIDDLLVREREPWFDPAGFFLAERDGELIGFHWTKVHKEGLGEVYVVGVDPAAQGLGLGKVLTIAGLDHLRARGLATAMLYVEEDNRAAVSLYQSLGFTHWSTDVMYG
jgi:mycothiol synthase